MKYLYYTALPWPDLEHGFDSFPHNNTTFSSTRAVEVYREAVELFVEAERAGFDWLGVGEEHMNAYGIVPNPTLFLSTLAALTKRAKLAILGNPVPLLNPLRVAEEYAMVDILSDGRMIAGFPRGVPQNYAAYNLDSSASRGQLSEAIDLIRKAWHESGPFRWDGTHYSFESVSLWPQPVQENPTLVFSCKSSESIDLAVKHRGVMAEIYIKNRAVLNDFERGMETYQQAARRSGWEATADNFALSVPCVVGPTDAEAAHRASRALHYQHTRLAGSYEKEKALLGTSYYRGATVPVGQSMEEVTDRISYGGLICGSPATVIGQIRTLSQRFDLGVLGLQMHYGDLTHSEILDSIRLFGSKVRPALSAAA